MADYSSSRQYEARRAYGDRERSIEIHGSKMETFNVDIRKNGAMKNRALVLAGLGGLCAAAGIFAATALHGPAQMRDALWQPSRLAKSFLWTLCGGAGIAYVSTSSFAFERSIYDLELSRELWEIENHLSGELQEMIAIYKSQGLSQEEAVMVTNVFAKRKLLFANLMMVEELGYSRLEPPTTVEALTNAGVPAMVGFAAGLLSPVMMLVALLHTTQSNAASSAPSLINKAHVLSLGVLAVCNVAVSFIQTEVFFGAYAHMPERLRTTVSNAVGIGSLYGLSYLAARFA